MNRLSPLITRKVGRHALVVPYPVPFAFEAMPVAQWLDDLRLFATGWVGGLIVFGTFFG